MPDPAHPRTVVFGVDFTPVSLDAVQWAHRLLGPETEAILTYVVEIPRAPEFLRLEDPGHRDIVSAARREAEDALQRLAGELGGERIDVEVRVGKAAEELAAAAQERGADLAVTGPHGHRSGLRGFLGSTAEQLLRICPVPVLMVTSPSKGTPSHVLATVDDSDLTGPVLAAARGVAERIGARVTALHAVSPAIFRRIRLVGTRESAATGVDPALERGRCWLRERLTETGFGESEAEATAVLGDPAHEIVAAAARTGAGLIVMGSRGAGSPGEFFLGSVTRVVLANAPCPVLVVTDSV